MKTIKEFCSHKRHYIVCNSKKEFLAVLKLCGNPRNLDGSAFRGSKTAIDTNGRYSNSIDYMKKYYIFYCNASDLLNQSYEIY